jgi:tRNA (guanine10-N2)-dimethyltransferase
VPKLFFLLSGEHEHLPVSELRAILEAEGYRYTLTEKLDQLLRLRTDPDCIAAVKRRAALTKLCTQEIFTCEATKDSIERNALDTDFSKILRTKESFCVRVEHVKTHGSNLSGMELEKRLGEIILEKTSESNVNLKHPDRVFIGILTSGRFVFGVKLAEIQSKPFFERRPRKKPFFHPSAMQAKLARCMVNLSKPKTNDLVLDPFSGTGGMLVEAAFIGCRVLAVDIQRRMARGTRKNLSHFNIEAEGIIVADARNLPLNKVDCVVTDPPYGRSTITMKRSTAQIVIDVLTAVHELLNKHGRICIAVPRTLSIADMAKRTGYKPLESHFVYVHRSLTREITVLEKR